MWSPVFNATSIAALAAAADRRIVTALREAGATSAASAVEFVPATALERQRLASLLERGAVREPVTGRFYVEEAWRAERREGERRPARRLPVVLLGLLALALAVAAVLLLR